MVKAAAAAPVTGVVTRCGTSVRIRRTRSVPGSRIALDGDVRVAVARSGDGKAKDQKVTREDRRDREPAGSKKNQKFGDSTRHNNNRRGADSDRKTK